MYAEPKKISITGGISSAAKALKGNKISIKAKTPKGKTFVKWQVLKGSVKIANENAEATTFIMSNSDVEIKAVFKDKKQIKKTEIYRLYNPNNGEHLYTQNVKEKTI